MRRILIAAACAALFVMPATAGDINASAHVTDAAGTAKVTAPTGDQMTIDVRKGGFTAVEFNILDPRRTLKFIRDPAASPLGGTITISETVADDLREALEKGTGMVKDALERASGELNEAADKAATEKGLKVTAK